LTVLEIWARPHTWLSLLSLAAMEIVLGIDNVVFISLLTGRLPRRRQALARTLGLTVAMIARLLLLLTLAWVMRLTRPLFSVAGFSPSGRDLILLLGGLFLVAKATHEIYEKLEGSAAEAQARSEATSLRWVLLQILLLDVVFSLDSVVTAVGMARHVSVMAAAIVLAVGVMLIFAGPIGAFVNGRPSMKVLALAFLLLIGVFLILDGLGQHVDKGYIYFAMAFSLLVEVLNMRLRRARRPVPLHRRYQDIE
jgi:predicted tellurium resistance membrane protein TerC